MESLWTKLKRREGTTKVAVSYACLLFESARCARISQLNYQGKGCGYRRWWRRWWRRRRWRQEEERERLAKEREKNGGEKRDKTRVGRKLVGINKVKRKQAWHRGGQGRQLALPRFRPIGSAPFLPGGRVLVTSLLPFPVWSGQSRSDSRQSVTGRRTGTTLTGFPEALLRFRPIRIFTQPTAAGSTATCSYEPFFRTFVAQIELRILLVIASEVCIGPRL